jgi:V/A-type H+-transporting ATPase subunit A
MTDEFLRLLQTESELQEIVKLVGMDALSDEDSITLETARSVREDFLQQNAFDEGDSFTQAQKMLALMDLILTFDKKMRAAAARGVAVQDMAALPVREAIGRAKSIPFTDFSEKCGEIIKQMEREIAALCDRV